MGNLTRDLPPCSIVPLPTTLPRVFVNCLIPRPCRIPIAAGRVRAQVMWDFVMDKVALGAGILRVIWSAPPLNSHYTDCSTLIIYHPGLIQWAKQWPTYQLDSVSPNPTKINPR
jgi:hypothetical protein